MNRFVMRCVGFALLVAAVTGCVPGFENPLPLSPDARADAAITGSWKAKDWEEGTEMYLVVLPRKTAWMDFVLVSGKGDNSANVSRFEGYATRLGKDKFLSLREVDAEGNAPTNAIYVLAYYAVSRRDLTITMFSPPKVKALIEDGTLSGTIGEGFSDDKVSSASEAVAAAITNKGLKAFVDDKSVVLKFTRVTK